LDLQTIKNRFGIVGSAPALMQALNIAERVASTDLTVLITGESGVGKEVFSQIIHALSQRKHAQFIAVNCGAIPEGTIDSELFGHEKGAFTGAVDKRKGYFETVEGGTIFLDEIGEMPSSTQARLLRLLQNGEFIKVGSSIVQKTNVRVIAATNVNLQELIRKGKFREDLYYRLNTVPIQVPPLRDRGDDIQLLFRKFATDFAEKNKIQSIKLTEEAKAVLQKYHWPGNVRQLKNLAEQITILTTERDIDGYLLSSYLPQGEDRVPFFQGSSQQTFGDHHERDLLYKFLIDIKQDINDIKRWMIGMSQTDFNTDTFESKMPFNPNITALPSSMKDFNEQHTSMSDQLVISPKPQNQPLNLEIEETMSMADMEKMLIKKALKKYKGKRKPIADELQISERTLLRKIIEYKLEDK
jgi:transcriptional regulator with PAS, ATPase and Fis domain